VCLPAVAVLVAAVLGGCGSSGSGHASHDGGSTTTAAGAVAGTQLQVVAKSFAFDPSTITVKSGDNATIVLTAKDLPHDFTVTELGIHVHADGGRTVKGAVAFDKPGTYTYFCSIAGHREAGMVGKLVVQ
jgi:plastocyanin